MQQDGAKALWAKFKAGRCTEEERLLVENWFHHLNLEEPVNLSEAELEVIHHEMWQSIRPNEILGKRYWPLIAAAASVILCLSVGAFYFLNKEKVQEQVSHSQQHDFAPGGNRAILTLANGQTISLNNIKNGNIAQQQGVQIKKAQNGQLIYIVNPAIATNSSLPVPIAYNTVSTPRGGQWQLILPDGSHVWLNAASSITFPTAFTGNSRNVKITGEAYFEVVHNAAMPFSVSVNNTTIEDIGTHFNINAYDDEASIKTTLVEGSVRVVSPTEAATLVPGQQSVITRNDTKIKVTKADVDETIAWKNGIFQFDRADIQTIMREFARWYDVNVDFTGKIPVRAFSGSIDRNSKASVALQILTIEGVHFKIEDKEIIVQP